MHVVARRLRFLLAACALASAGNLFADDGDAGGWIDLSSADDLSAWRRPTGEWIIVGEALTDPHEPRRLIFKPGRGTLLNGATGRTDHLVTRFEHGDVEAHVEFMVSKGSNSGVYFQGRYEIQILDSWGVDEPKYSDCGGIYQRWKEDEGYEGAPRVNASRKPGEWQSFDVIFRAPRFDASGNKTENARFERVVHNGKVIHEDAEVTGPTRAALFADEQSTGPLMIQGDHGPVALRNVRIRPLEPNQP